MARISRTTRTAQTGWRVFILFVVSAPYEADGQVVGILVVIGPTRMPYEKVIEIVDITARLVSNALNTQGCR